MKHFLLLLAINLMASSLFRAIAVSARNMVIANTFGSFVLLLLFALGGFVLSRGKADLVYKLIKRITLLSSDNIDVSLCQQRISKAGGFGVTGVRL